MMTETTDLQRLIVSLEANVKKYERELAKATRTADVQSKKIEKRFDSMNKRVSASLKNYAKGAGAALLGAVTIRELQRYADMWVRVENNLRTAGIEGENLARTLDDLYRIAQANGTAIEPLTTLYGRLAQSQDEIGATSAQMIKFTEGVSLALRVQGGDAQSASGALLQLSQALGGAVVRAEEFNSINEGARPILQAVANGLEEAGGSVSKLRKLVLEGEVSSRTFFNAFLAGMSDLEQKAANAEQTTGQSLVTLQNAFGRLVSKMDDLTGASAAVVEFFNDVANVLDRLTDTAESYGDEIGRIVELYRYLEQFTPSGLTKTILSGRDLLGAGSDGQDASDLQTPDGPAPGRLPVGTKKVSIRDDPVDDDDDSSKKSIERANAFERETEALLRKVEALTLEAEVLGKTTFEQEKARAAAELLNAAIEAGITIDDELIKSIDALATEYATATAGLEDLRIEHEAFNEVAGEFKSTSRSIFSGFISDLQNGISLADALANSLQKVADKLFSLSLDALFSDGDGLSGILKGIGGLFGGFRVDGGGVTRGKAYVVGEKRPELFVPGASGTIIPEVPTAAAAAPATIRVILEGQPGPLFEPTVAEIASDRAITVVDKSLSAFGRDAVPVIAKSAVRQGINRGEF